MPKWAEWIDKLDLQPHPEGGYYRETYRSQNIIPASALATPFGAERCASTAIYYLLAGDDFSALHRLRQDELFHFYDGAAALIHLIDPAGDCSTVRLGRDPHQGEAPQVVVRGGHLFGVTVADPAGYTLMGCTVAPGFDFADFEMPTRAELVALYPQHRLLIERLTRNREGAGP